MEGIETCRVTKYLYDSLLVFDVYLSIGTGLKEKTNKKTRELQIWVIQKETIFVLVSFVPPTAGADTGLLLDPTK